MRNPLLSVLVVASRILIGKWVISPKLLECIIECAERQ